MHALKESPIYAFTVEEYGDAEAYRGPDGRICLADFPSPPGPRDLCCSVDEFRVLADELWADARAAIKRIPDVARSRVLTTILDDEPPATLVRWMNVGRLPD